MDAHIRRYLSEIGKRGGRKSKRALDRKTAQQMVRIREAKRAFRNFHTACFWSYRPELEIELSDIPWIAEQLRKNGNRKAWEVADRLCR